MSLSEAIRKRIYEILDEKNISITALSLNSLITPSTLFDFMLGRSDNPHSFTVKKICYGAGITLKDFYDREYFNDFSDVVK